MQELQLLKDKQVLEQALRGTHAAASGAPQDPPLLLKIPSPPPAGAASGWCLRSTSAAAARSGLVKILGGVLKRILQPRYPTSGAPEFMGARDTTCLDEIPVIPTVNKLISAYLSVWWPGSFNHCSMNETFSIFDLHTFASHL